MHPLKSACSRTTSSGSCWTSRISLPHLVLLNVGWQLLGVPELVTMVVQHIRQQVLDEAEQVTVVTHHVGRQLMKEPVQLTVVLLDVECSC